MDYKDASGRCRQQKAGRTKTLAHAALRKRLDEVAQERIFGDTSIRSISFADFMDEYLTYSRASKRQSSARRDLVSSKNLMAHFGGKRLTEITVKDIENYKARRSSEVSRASVNRELACLKNMFSKAIQWHYAYQNPVKAVKLFRENNTVVRYLNEKEKDLLLAYCPREIRAVVLTALNTGMRRAEIFNLKWYG
jgi:site-specific recombinase XerD